jgi:23S rRNA (adenine2030-N6)-methyltransferase
MLSYQHGFHAGNFADVLKHLVLVEVLNYLIKKDKPLCYLESHAGRGLYHLADVQAQKNKEYLSGIAKIWQHADAPDAVVRYVDLIKKFNHNNVLTTYPGSPLLAASMLRAHDRLFAFEQHPQEFAALSQVVGKDKRFKIKHADSSKAILGLLPPSERRGLILVDPSYELKADYQGVIDMVIEMVKRFNTGCYLLWYPVLADNRAGLLERTIKKTGIADIQQYKLGIAPNAVDSGMTASAMLVINAPFTLMPAMRQALPWLAEKLSLNQQGYWEISQLTSE